MEFLGTWWVAAIGAGALIGLILYLIFGRNPERELLGGTVSLYAKILLIAIPCLLLVGLIIRIGDFGTGKIRNWYDLNAVRNKLDRSFILMNNLDSTSAGYEELAGATANGGEGWQPLGRMTVETWEPEFSGSFDGQGFEIRDLFINRPDESYVGLFGRVDRYGVIKNVVVVNASVTGRNCVGGLVGANGGTVTNSSYNGTVSGTGDEYIGGIVGRGTASNSYFNGDLIGNEEVVGLMGENNDGTVCEQLVLGHRYPFAYLESRE